MKLVLILFGCLTTTVQVILAENRPPIVNIPHLGHLEGTYKTSLKGQNFLAFEGVPYARPPVGKYRFREPVPPKPWHGVWQAKTIYKCMQNYQYTEPGEDPVIGDEDCLYLNIYTPTLNPTSNLDVVVYIHGGAFMFLWGGFQGPEYLLDKNLVYVNLNYRLGPLGFLSTEDDIVPGNNGLKDQILALRWIKDNVKYFGGNPDSVTLVGMSAGGASVHFHYLAPKSSGLFHKGLSQSGTMLNPWVLQEQPLQKAQKLATSAGCTIKDVKQMIECLKRRPGKLLVAAVKDFQPWLYNPFSPFGVVVDKWATDPVLPDHPYQLLKKGQVKDLPWISSYTNSEGLYPGADFYQKKLLEDVDQKWNQLLPLILDYNLTVEAEELDSVSGKIREYYLQDRVVDKKTFLDFIEILSDRLFLVDIEKTVRLQAKMTSSPVYFYHFTYRGAHSKSEARSKTNKDFGACHGDDTSYIFKTTLDTTSTENDRKMVDLMTEMVASFAKTGKPNVPNEWPPVNTKELVYLKISSPSNLTLQRSVFDSEAFWDSLPIKENEKLYSGVKDEL